MKQEIKEAINKVFENLELLLHACVFENKSDDKKTIIEFNYAQVDMQNLIHITNEKLKLSKSDQEEIDKYYYIKMTELLDYYFKN